MRARRSASLLLLFVACAAPGSQPSAERSPTVSAPVVASARPSTVVSPGVLPLSTVEFSCVLPVYGYAGAGAFISFPARTLAKAKESGYYYDRAVLRWLPVFRWQVSPDGLSYAYTEGWSAEPPKAPRLHIANAATGKDQRVVTMPDAKPFQVVDFTGAAIYLVISFEGTAPGVWRVNRGGGAAAKVSNGFYQLPGATWIGVVDPRDPHPSRSLAYGTAQPNRVDRRDDAGRTTTWFYAPGSALSWVAFSGTPAVLISAFRQDSPTAAVDHVYWLVEGPGRATRVQFSVGASIDLAGGFGSAIADAHGIWLGASGSLYLVRRSGAILRVFDGSVYPANGCF